MAENTHLPKGPEELEKIGRIRDRLIKGGADADQIAEVNDWEKKTKDALIFLNLQKHEGIQAILKRALEEVRDIDLVLLDARPENLSTEAALKFAHETVMLLDRKALWKWFIDLFGMAAADLDAIRAEIETQLEDDPDDDGLEDLDTPG